MSSDIAREVAEDGLFAGAGTTGGRLAAEAAGLERCGRVWRNLVGKIPYGQKLKLLKGGSVPTFLVLDRCCTTSLPWTLE